MNPSCSPLRRGWSLLGGTAGRSGLVLPAQAGVVPGFVDRAGRGWCAPRSGGGGPNPRRRTSEADECSPLRRGWSHGDDGGLATLRVLPAQAGVVPFYRYDRTATGGAPRSGGGGPWTAAGRGGRRRCSPLRRGWSAYRWGTSCSARVLPAQAGVVPASNTTRSQPTSAPRSGGGGPTDETYPVCDVWCSPLRRGWSLSRSQGSPRWQVLPAQAGVVPCVSASCARWLRAPRSGGGGPEFALCRVQQPWCSPLRRGWSLRGRLPSPSRGVLPAQAGVVPAVVVASGTMSGAPRSGGGGPLNHHPNALRKECSPLRRGWSPARQPTLRSSRVLPAQAGVVPSRPRILPPAACAPRSGGGGPIRRLDARLDDACSPLRRGWSLPFQLAPHA